MCTDANSIDREINLIKPDICIIEAVWVPPYKMAELSELWPNVTFIIRVHSKIPFLANEGIAIDWIKEYNQIKNVIVSFNNKETNEDFRNLGIDSVFLPNLYPTIRHFNDFKYFLESIKEKFCKIFGCGKKQTIINIGCFGAIRPLKNQLSQAFAAITYADMNDKILHYHINGTRIEQRGETVLKNLRELFKNTRHKLTEHPWMEHHDFLKIINQMDLGLQVSYTESFNIVTADFVTAKVPIVASDDISWMPWIMKVSPTEHKGIVRKLKLAYKYRGFITWLQSFSLKTNRLITKSMTCRC
jgi:hypothetical protein